MKDVVRTAVADRERLRFLFATAETHPTHRADVRVLFGKYLPEFGIHTDLIAASPRSTAQVPWAGGRLLSKEFGSRLGLLVVDLAQQLSLFVRCFQGYDGLIVRDKPFLGAIGLLAARLAGIPFVYWMSFPMPEADLAIARSADRSVRWLRRLHTWLRGKAGSFVLYRAIVPQADFLFVQSPVMRDELRARGLRHERVASIPMGVDVESVAGFSARREGTADRAGERRAVYLGTLSALRRRELEVMIDAAREVHAVRPEFVLLVIGEADTEQDKGWLRRYAEGRNAAQCVRFLGWLPHDEGLVVAGTCDVGLSPFPRGELFESASPTKAVEYMALGLPVVCNDQPDQAHVVHESGAGICVELSAHAFASAILRLLEEPSHAQSMGRSGQRWVRENRNYRHLASRVAEPLSALARYRCAGQASGVPR